MKQNVSWIKTGWKIPASVQGNVYPEPGNKKDPKEINRKTHFTIKL